MTTDRPDLKIFPSTGREWLWWMRNAPQRKHVQCSLKVDWHQMAELKRVLRQDNWGPKEPLKAVSVCIGLKNRSENLERMVLRSIREVENQELVELCIYDMGSMDYDRLLEIIPEYWKGKLRIEQNSEPFTRAKAYNGAISLASNPIVYLNAADVSLAKDLVYKANKVLSTGAAWYPIVYWLEQDENPEAVEPKGKWWYSSPGMVAMYKSDFKKVGGYNEEYKTWGDEDWDLYMRLYEIGVGAIRSYEKEKMHLWHPKQNPADFKSKFI